jgi:hypothetical protein
LAGSFDDGAQRRESLATSLATLFVNKTEREK